MSDQRIARADVSRVERGMYVIDVDDEELQGDEIDGAYDAGEQDWQHVIAANHRADQSQLVLAYWNGEAHVTGWHSGDVWLLVDRRGEPVVQDPEDS